MRYRDREGKPELREGCLRENEKEGWISGGEEGIKTDGDRERMCEEVCERESRRASKCVCVCESKTKCRSS